MTTSLRIAVVHEWLTHYAGSERVVEQILQLYPSADLFSIVDFLPPSDRAWLRGKQPTTTFIQRLPFARTHCRHYLPLMPLAIENLDLSAYDLVLSSSHAVAKGVLTGPDQLHVCYCHTPLRYAWDLQHQYLRESGYSRGLRGLATRALLHYLRLWDVRASHGVDLFVANSHYIARRIRKAYRRDAEVLYPPVDVDFFQPGGRRENFYLAASRMAPYKRMSLIVEAFARLPERQLVVAGDGPDLARCRALATGNVSFTGYQTPQGLRDLMQRARALVFAAEEDFGILVAEAQACGTPVICYARGGAAEIVADRETGILFDEQSADAIVAAVNAFEAEPGRFDPVLIRNNAERFRPERFREEFRRLVEDAWQHRDSAPARAMPESVTAAMGSE